MSVNFLPADPQECSLPQADYDTCAAEGAECRAAGLPPLSFRGPPRDDSAFAAQFHFAGGTDSRPVGT